MFKYLTTPEEIPLIAFSTPNSGRLEKREESAIPASVHSTPHFGMLDEVRVRQALTLIWFGIDILRAY